VKLYAIMCAPGYQVSGSTRAFMAKRPLGVGDNRIQRERLGRTAASAHVLTVVTDVPDSMSALSFVRRA